MTTTVKYLVVVRDGSGRVLVVRDGDLRQTIEHETRLGSVIVGEYAARHIAEKAAKQAESGGRRIDMRTA